MIDFEKEFSTTLSLALQVIGERHRITAQTQKGEAIRKLRSFSDLELQVCAEALQALSPEGLQKVLANPKAFATAVQSFVEAHPGRPGNTLALLSLGRTTMDLGIYFPKAAAEAIDCSVYTGRKGEHYICLNNTAGEAPIYRLYLDELNVRARLVVDIHLIDDNPGQGGYLP